MDLGGWLRSLGLEKYEAVLRDNEIDDTVLHKLKEDHLRELGFPLGARLKLLDAIAALAPQMPADAAPIKSSPSAPPSTSAAAEAAAERRQLTVMFCDLVGSTALSARMDPEDLREVISTYQKCVADTVRRFDGFVAKYMGDGVLVYFGYPQAHEDDTERAVRAGLELIAAVTGLETRAPLQTRVGIATGLVVVGDLIGSGEAQERGIVGETPNLAARLQAAAAPGTVVIGPATRRLLAGLFEYCDLGCVEVKGFAKPIQAYEVVRPSTVESRFEALHATALTALVGREEELELLLRRWSTAKTGEGQVVLLSGEAGIGKSRLTAALMERLAAKPHTRLRYFCSPQHTDSALYPIIGQMERAAGLTHDDTAQAKLDKLDAVLAQTSTSIEHAALFAEMLSLPNDGRYPALELVPQQRRQRTLEALISQLEALERQSPVLMIFEDAHWTDPTSLEVFGCVVDRITTLRVLLILTFRPEFDPPWIGRPHVTALTINRLGQREVRAVIDRLVGNKLLPVSIRQDIIERTDGIPLFVEEMTKAVLEAESDAAAEHTLAAVPSPSLAVPASLHASLMARLDRLGPAKEVAQIGATIGREFSHALLAAVVRKPEPELLSALDRLVATGLLFRQGVPPHASYLFKHTLVRDAAYDTLLRERRRGLHARIAEALESQFAETAESRPEFIARHLTEAGLHERAASYWQRAGDLALQRSAAREATAHFSAALAAVMKLPETLARDRLELDARLGVGTALVVMRTAAHAEVAEHYDRAVTLARRLGADVQLFRALWGSWFNEHSVGNSDPALTLADELVGLARQLGDENLVLEAHHSRWASAHRRGLNPVTLADTEQGIALYEPARHHVLTYDYAGHDTGVCARAQNAITLWITGFPERASQRAIDALALARRLNHAPSIVHAGWWTAMVRQLLCEPEACRELAELTMRIAAQEGIHTFMCPSLLGWCRFKAGHIDQGLRLMERAVAVTRQTARRFYIDYELLVFADALLQSGEPGRAQVVVDEALTYIERSGARLYEAESYRLRGECLAAMGHEVTAEVESSIRKGIAIAESQGALSLALRASLSLARLLNSRGDRSQARDLLAAVHARFTEGFATHDLKCAEALLDTINHGGAAKNPDGFNND
jgi:class 3 adenylate cyclase/predicted ATPase